MKNELTKIERRVLALFFSHRNENGRVQVWTAAEMRAAWKLASKGLLRVSPHCRHHWQTPCTKAAFCRDFYLNLWRTDAGYTEYVNECVAFYGDLALTELRNGRPPTGPGSPPAGHFRSWGETRQGVKFYCFYHT